MKDKRGLYYYPNPADKNLRMYVRRASDLEFRLWNAKEPQIWERHGWVPLPAIKLAAEKYKQRGKDSNPLSLYDAAAAELLLKDDA